MRCCFILAFFVCERCKVALNQNKPHSFIPRKRKKVRLTVLSWNCSRLDFFLSLRIGSVCTVHVAHTRTLYSWSRKCLHLSVYMCWGSTGINKETEIQLCLKEEKKTHCCRVVSDAHCIYCPGQYNFTSSPRWNLCQHHGKPCEGARRVGLGSGVLWWKHCLF